MVLTDEEISYYENKALTMNITDWYEKYGHEWDMHTRICNLCDQYEDNLVIQSTDMWSRLVCPNKKEIHDEERECAERVQVQERGTGTDKAKRNRCSATIGEQLHTRTTK